MAFSSLTLRGLQPSKVANKVSADEDGSPRSAFSILVSLVVFCVLVVEFFYHQGTCLP